MCGWENQEPENKNLEAMRNELSLENIMNTTVMTTEPTTDDVGEGQFRQYNDGTDLYLYTKLDGVLKKIKWT